MNIAIEQTEEYVNGQLKNKYGDAFLRGNNGKIRLNDLDFLCFYFLTAAFSGVLELEWLSSGLQFIFIIHSLIWQFCHLPQCPK